MIQGPLDAHSLGERGAGWQMNGLMDGSTTDCKPHWAESLHSVKSLHIYGTKSNVNNTQCILNHLFLEGKYLFKAHLASGVLLA